MTTNKHGNSSVMNAGRWFTVKTIKAVLYGNKVKCPCCGSYLTIGATIRLGCEREIGQMTIGPGEGDAR